MSAVSTDFQVSLPELVAGALTLTAALAWNEAAKKGIQALYPQPNKGSAQATFVYALVVTILVIIIFVAIRAASQVADKIKNGSFLTKAAGPAKKTPMCARSYPI